jgi:hypothetical protein
MRSDKRERNTLGLVGDGDELGLIKEVETSFGVQLPRSRLTDALTMGDIHRVLVEVLAASKGPRRICLSMSVFYRIRRALKNCGVVDRITPDSNLNALLEKIDVRRFRATLNEGGKLQLPPTELKTHSWAIFTLVAGSGLGLAIGLQQPLAVAATVFSLVGLAFLLPRQFRKGYASLSDLTKYVLAMNFATIIKPHGPPHPDDVWCALATIA